MRPEMGRIHEAHVAVGAPLFNQGGLGVVLLAVGLTGMDCVC